VLANPALQPPKPIVWLKENVFSPVCRHSGKTTRQAKFRWRVGAADLLQIIFLKVGELTIAHLSAILAKQTARNTQ